MSQKIWVDFAYSLEHRKVRDRKMKWERLRGSAMVEIPEAEAFEAPAALVDAYDRNRVARRSQYGSSSIAPRTDTWTRGNLSISPGPTPAKETVTTRQSGHGGRLYRELRAPFAGDGDGNDRFKPLRLDQLDGHGDNVSFRDHPFLRQEDQAKFRSLRTREDFIDVNVRETGRDYEEMARRIVAGTARDLLLVNGVLHRAQVEPVYIVQRAPRSVEIAWERPYRTCKASGIPFPLDRYDDALAFARALASEVGVKKVEEPYRRCVSVDPTYLGLRMPVVTASLLANGALALAGEFEKVGGAAGEVAAEIKASLGGGAKGVYPSVAMGDPYDFADRLADIRASLAGRDVPAFERADVARLMDGMQRLYQPVRVHKDLGLAPDGPGMAGDDLDSLTDLVDDFVMPGAKA